MKNELNTKTPLNAIRFFCLVSCRKKKRWTPVMGKNGPWDCTRVECILYRYRYGRYHFKTFQRRFGKIKKYRKICKQLFNEKD